MSQSDEQPTTENPTVQQPAADPTLQQPAATHEAVQQPVQPAPVKERATVTTQRRVAAAAGVGVALVGGLVGFGIGHATAGDDGHDRFPGRPGFGQADGGRGQGGPGQGWGPRDGRQGPNVGQQPQQPQPSQSPQQNSDQSGT